jgi:hypothetical protein
MNIGDHDTIEKDYSIQIYLMHWGPLVVVE